jgi:hypothetical protein
MPDHLVRADEPRERVVLELNQSVPKWIDELRSEWGLQSRGAIVERLLEEIQAGTVSSLWPGSNTNFILDSLPD